MFGVLGYVEKLTSPPARFIRPPITVVTNSLRNIPYALADYTTFLLGVTSSNWREVISFFRAIG